MDFKRAIRIIRSNCKISPTLPISGECNENCEFYNNCIKTVCPTVWTIPKKGEKIVIEAIDKIHNYCLNTPTCENCEFYEHCNEKIIPSFWELEDEELIE